MSIDINSFEEPLIKRVHSVNFLFQKGKREQVRSSTEGHLLSEGQDCFPRPSNKETIKTEI